MDVPHANQSHKGLIRRRRVWACTGLDMDDLFQKGINQTFPNNHNKNGVIL